MLTIMYSVCEGSVIKKVRMFAVEQFISKIKTGGFPEIQQYQNTLPSEKRNIANLLEYLNQKRLIEATWLTENVEIADGKFSITDKGVDYIEKPFDTLIKEYPRSINISNIMNLNAGRDLNILEAALIQKNTQKFTDSELEGLNEKLEEIKKIISDTSQKEIFEEIHKDLENSDRVSAAQKLSKFQYFITKVKDIGALIQTTSLIYKIIGKIYSLPDIGF